MTPKQKRFVAAYLKNPNATQAAIEAGYSAHTAGSQGHDLLKNPEIAAAVGKNLEKAEIEAVEVLRELRRIALCDIGGAFDEDGKLKAIKDMPEDVRRAISAVETEELWEPQLDDAGHKRMEHTGDVRKVKFWEKTKALEQLGRYLKLFVDKQEISGPDGQPFVLNVTLTKGAK